MANQIAKTQNSQKGIIEKYKELFRFVERTGEEVFVLPKKRKVGIILKPIDVLRKEFEVKDALGKIQRGKKEYQTGKSEEFEVFLNKKYPQYVDAFNQPTISRPL